MNNIELALAVNTNLFIGAFEQREGKSATPGPNTFVFLIDDTRSGPIPVRATEFDAVKKLFAEERPAKELGTLQLTCNQPDRVCASLSRPDGGFVYTELVNVKGRVVMISAASTSLSASDAAGGLPKYVGTFVEQLRSDNAQ